MILCAGCVKLGESSELPLAAVQATPLPPDRINCGEILGTAFRSDNERQWFMDNCSKWPLVKVADEPAPGQTGAPSAPAEPPECAQIRGKPYESSQQRQWYLQNCNQNAAPRTGGAATPNPQPQGQTQTSGGPDRTDCNAIRGTAYRSPTERTWYIQNCGSTTNTPPQQPAPPQQPDTPQQPNTQLQLGTGPNRFDCNAIRGTAYRSPSEQAWFNANCR
jgi:hypothetical protein